MSEAQVDNASFRDPRGQVYHFNDRILRTVMPIAQDDFDFVRSTGLIKKLITDKKLLSEAMVNLDVLGEAGKGAIYLLEHPRLPFIAYPYEWPFAMLKAAALLQLDIQLQALDYGVTLTDASAFNIQFQDGQPIFIDHLAFRPYRAGEIWQGHRQFCEQFLNPLLLQAYLGVSYQAWYRGALEGIKAQELNCLLPWYRKCIPKVLMHVVLQSSLQKTPTQQAKKIVKKINLPLSALQNMLRGLKSWIEKLEPKKISNTAWGEYSTTYVAPLEKTVLVTEFIKHTKPGLIFDLGCNNGVYSELALEVGAGYVVGIDDDQGALEQACIAAQTKKLAFLPLYMDFANPTPNQGWANVERNSFMSRGPADAVLALAIIHHLTIARNIPLDQLLNYLIDLAPNGLLEFVPKTDPLVQELLALRTDIFADYTEENFLHCISQRAEIIKSEIISASGRRLVWYKRKLC